MSLRTDIDDAAVETIVEAVLQRLRQGTVAPGGRPLREAGLACTPEPRPVHAVAQPASAAMLARLVALTPSQIAMGRAGNRFRTEDYLRAREGQADARDAVHSEVPEEWAARHKLLALRTQCADRQEYLLFPNKGRRLDPGSVAALSAHAPSAAGVQPDVQLIVGDGLSPNAIVQNGEATLLSMQRAVQSAGFTLGVGCYVKFARIAVADEIGVLTRARATVILVGERPGLGTGDSLSVYIAINPKLGQDNAEKNCISNVRPIGIAPEEAAALTISILKRGFDLGVGGVAVGLGWGRQ